MNSTPVRPNSSLSLPSATAGLPASAVWASSNVRPYMMPASSSAKLVALTLVLAPVFANAQHAPPLPAEVAQYIERRDRCEHWRGEEIYDKERELEVLAGLCRDCVGSDKQLAALRDKHRKNVHVTERLLRYEHKIEPMNNADRSPICKGPKAPAKAQ